MNVRAAAVLIVLSLSTVACAESLPGVEPLSRGSDEPSTAATPVDGTPIATTTIEPGAPLAELAIDAPPWSEPTIELLDAGAEPRGEVRMAPTPGATLQIRRVESVTSTGRAGTYVEEVVVPSVEVDQDITVAGADGDRYVLDTYFLDYRMPSEASMDRASIEYVRSIYNTELGTTLRTHHLADGSITASVRLAPSGNAQGGTEPDVSHALPAEPIGPGARWRTIIVIEEDGAVLEAVTDYELLEVHDDRAIARFDTVLTPSGDFGAPGAEVVSAEFRRSGTASWVLWAGAVLVDETTAVRVVMRDVRQGRSIEATVEENTTVVTRVR